MDRFQKKKLHQLALLEQTMATGVTDEGKKPKLAQLTNDLDQMLRSDEVQQFITRLFIAHKQRHLLLKIGDSFCRITTLAPPRN
jgi:hypothetical protein